MRRLLATHLAHGFFKFVSRAFPDVFYICITGVIEDIYMLPRCTCHAGFLYVVVIGPHRDILSQYPQFVGVLVMGVLIDMGPFSLCLMRLCWFVLVFTHCPRRRFHVCLRGTHVTYWICSHIVDRFAVTLMFFVVSVCWLNSDVVGSQLLCVSRLALSCICNV